MKKQVKRPYVYIAPYLDKMERIIDENIDDLREPQAISHAFNLSFDIIYDSFLEKIKKYRDLNFNKFLFEALKEENPILASDFGFIKYIHIFNYANFKEKGAIDIGVDFVNQKIIDDCMPLETGNSLFRKDTIAIFYNYTNGFFGNNIIEYCNTPKATVLDPLCYSIITSRWDDVKNYRVYDYSPLFKFLLTNKENIQTCRKWFERFENNITHYARNTNYFFIQSNNVESNLFDDNWEYVIYANIGIDSTKANKECITVFLQKITQFLDKITFVMLLSISRKKLIQTAKLNATSLVMARNMSHNFGSHVLSNLISNDVYEKVSDTVVLQNDAYQPLEDHNNFAKDDASKNLQLTYFNQYLKNRMDYICEVSTGIPNMLTTNYIYKDVFKQLDRERILLNYISGIQDFRYEFRLKYNGKPLTEDNDIAAAFSGGVLGIQAFYNIIENIIRNTAKHAYSRKQDVNVFTIEFTDLNTPGFYRVEIDDGIKIDEVDELVYKQNALIAESILDGDNYMPRAHGLGILEMKASIAFLRQEVMAEIDEENDNVSLPLLKAINKNQSLCYQFYIQKPKEILLIGEWDEIDENMKNYLDNFGVQFITLNLFNKTLGQGISYPHNFILYKVINSKDINKVFNNYDTLLSLRRIKLSVRDVKTLISIINNIEVIDIVNSIKEFIWTIYFKKQLSAELKNRNNHEIQIRTEADFEVQDNGYCSNQVIFLHHGYKNIHDISWKTAIEHDDCEVWIENLSSRTSSKLPEFYKYLQGEHVNPVTNYCLNTGRVNMEADRIRYSIFEAYHNKVIALDERIQKFAREAFEGSNNITYGGRIPCSELYKSTNVIIPDFLLDSISLGEKHKDDIECFIDKYINNAFLLIHYGILERLYKSEPTITNKLNEWATKAKRVVVTSGRGVYSLPLPPTVCYTDLSSILYAFVQERNKITINDLLNQSRRKNE